MNYDNIYISDGLGYGGHPFTVAVPFDKRWIVVMNMGTSAFSNPLSDPATLIHELVHAWQSQHYPDKPWQYMLNSLACQAKAQIASAVGTAPPKVVGGLVGGLLGLNGGLGTLVLPLAIQAGLGEASSYAYVPDRSFGDYGAEQIAQQVEDSYHLPAAISSAARLHITRIRDQVKGTAKNAHSAANALSLDSSGGKFEHIHTPNVVWHAP